MLYLTDSLVSAPCACSARCLGRGRYGVRTDAWTMTWLLDQCLPVPTHQDSEDNPAVQPWPGGGVGTTCPRSRGAILAWESSGEGRSVAKRKERQTCRRINPSHSTVFHTPSLWVCSAAGYREGTARGCCPAMPPLPPASPSMLDT